MSSRKSGSRIGRYTLLSRCSQSLHKRQLNSRMACPSQKDRQEQSYGIEWQSSTALRACAPQASHCNMNFNMRLSLIREYTSSCNECRRQCSYRCSLFRRVKARFLVAGDQEAARGHAVRTLQRDTCSLQKPIEQKKIALTQRKQ